MAAERHAILFFQEIHLAVEILDVQGERLLFLVLQGCHKGKGIVGFPGDLFHGGILVRKNQGVQLSCGLQAASAVHGNDPALIVEEGIHVQFVLSVETYRPVPGDHASGKAAVLFQKTVVFQPLIPGGAGQAVQVIGGNPSMDEKIGPHIQNGGKLSQKRNFRSIMFLQAFPAGRRIFRGDMFRGNAHAGKHVQDQAAAPDIPLPVHKVMEALFPPFRFIQKEPDQAVIHVSHRDIDQVFQI